MVQRWPRSPVAGALLFAVVGVLLYAWALAAGIVAHAISVVLLLLACRLRKHGPGLVDIAESLH